MADRKETIGRYVSVLYRSAGSYLSKELSRYNIGSGQFTFLLYLYNHHGVTQENMSSHLYIDKGTTARAIKKLEDFGYVYRITDETDRRAFKVYVTEKAQSIKHELYGILEKWNIIITADFTKDEFDATLLLLQRMVRNKNNFLSKGDNK